jgi:hypothetical protein
MLIKSSCVVLAVLVFTASTTVNVAWAAGGGAKGFCAGGRPAGSRTGFGHSGQFLRAGNGFLGSNWAFANAVWGWGGLGYGLDYGYGYPGLGYSPWACGYIPEHVPYFSLFPPVYYGNTDDVPVWNAAMRSSRIGIDSAPPVPESVAPASPPRPPLRIVNPYYVEAKADKP